MRTTRTPSLDIPPFGRIAILRALKLGDLLCAVPAFRALRVAFPRARIHLIGLPWARELVLRFHTYLDDFREFPGYPGLPERVPQLDRLPGFLMDLQQERYDLALQLHGNGSITNPLAVLLGARRTAGFFAPGNWCPDPRLFLPYPEDGLEIRRPLELLRFLGIEPQGEELEFPLFPTDRQAFERIEGTADLQPGQYVCLHPGASVPERRWPVQQFAGVARSLAEQGLSIVLTGSREETELTRALRQESQVPCLDLAGRTSLGVLAVLLSEARLLICNDTGVSHLAAALRVPSVVLFTRDNASHWAPIDNRLHRILHQEAETGPGGVLAQARELLTLGPSHETRKPCGHCVS